MADPVLATAAGEDRVWKFAFKQSWGYPFNYLRNVISHTGGYTHISKKVSAATAAAVLSSTAGAATKQTITAGITNPDVPRVLAITIGGSGYSSDSIVINGTNVEGKKIADTIAYTSNTQVLGALVFKTVTSVVIPSTSGTSMTLTVDTTAKIGIVHRCPPTFTTAVVIHNSTFTRVSSSTTNMPVIEAAPSASNFDNEFTEKNWVQPATAPNGTNFLYIFYWFHKVQVQPLKDSPQFYSTTTSTSTSSTSTSTSTSSTSTSTSISSTSVSSTSTSTSSTSTSTTTLPF